MTKHKLIALATSAALALSNTSIPIDAASQLKLMNVSTKKTMYVGKTFTIKTNLSTKKLTFKSSKTSIATVNKKGTIKAKKKGTCKITVTAKFSKKNIKKKTITLTVKKKVSTANPTATVVPSNTPSVAVTTTPATSVTNTPNSSNEPVVPNTTPDSSNAPSMPTITTAAPATQAPAVTTNAAILENLVASGSIFVSSVVFSNDGITLQDEKGAAVDPSDASNLVVVGNKLYITAPTNDLTNSKNDKEIKISGTCQNGQIVVNVDKTTHPDACVELSLEGLCLSNPTDSPIYIASIDDECVISVKKGTTNELSDGSSYKNEDDDTGVIYSKDDLKIKGKGSLTITGNCGYGIISKDDLKIYNGTINVTSVDAALKGKDSVKIGDKDDIGKDDAFANLKLTLKSTSGDGVRSNNPIDDATKVSEDKDYGDGKAGKIEINGGTISVNAYSDAFQSNGDFTVNGGTIDIYTYKGSEYVASTNTNSWGFFPGQGGRPGESSSSSSSLEVSAKGLKAEGNLTINDGTIQANCSDDTLHCGGTMTVNGGTMTLATGDDGLHSDSNLEINNGKITITKSYEGIEGIDIKINGGTIFVTSSDDGLNASDGSGESQIGNGGGGFGGPNNWQFWQGNNQTTSGSTTSSTTCNLTINGGYLYVSAEGDGLDSNGNLYVKGGTTIVVGPSSGGNGSFDYGDGNYTFEFTGGTLLAVGTSDMAVFPKNTTNYLKKNLSTSNSSNTIAIADQDGKVLSVLQFTKTARLLTYMSENVTASDCKVYLNPTYTGILDDFGYGTDGTITGGTEIK